MTAHDKTYECVIIGAGPGGLQAGIYLGRYNRKVLIIDRGGGRTMHARHVENVITQKLISGKEIIDLGSEQAKNFGVQMIRDTVIRVSKEDLFEVQTEKGRMSSRFVIAASGVYDNIPPIENVHKYMGTSFFTCVHCDGYRTTNKKLVIIGNSFETVRLSLGMREMYTRDIVLVLYTDKVPDHYKEELQKGGIELVIGRPVGIVGEREMEALEMKDGRRLACEVIMSNFGFKLHDSFISDLKLERDSKGFKYRVNSHFESTLSGLYIVGPLNTGHDQIVIAAGEGAVAAIDINKRLLEQ